MRCRSPEGSWLALEAAKLFASPSRACRIWLSGGRGTSACKVEVTATGSLALRPLARSGLNKPKSKSGCMLARSGSRSPGGLGGGEGADGKPCKDLPGRRRLGNICWYLPNSPAGFFWSKKSVSAKSCCCCCSCCFSAASVSEYSPCQPDLLHSKFQ